MRSDSVAIQPLSSILFDEQQFEIKSISSSAENSAIKAMESFPVKAVLPAQSEHIPAIQRALLDQLPQTGDNMRHPSGVVCKKTPLVTKSGQEEIVAGMAHSNKNVFEACDPGNNHKSLGKFAIADGVTRNEEGKVISTRKAIVDQACLLMKSALPLFRKKGVKSSKTSPTGYKYASSGQPCDKNGVPMLVSAVAQAYSSAAQPRYDPAVDAVPDANMLAQMAQSHWAFKNKARLQSAYADVIRATCDVRYIGIHDNLKAGLYHGRAAQSLPPHQALQHTISLLSSNIPDQARMIDFLNAQRDKFLSGEHMALPAYYHCCKDEAFESITDSSNFAIKAQTPRTGTGGAGAWLSTKPEVEAYGPYIFGLNRNMDFLHSTHSAERAPVRPRQVGDQYHIGIQETITLKASDVNSPNENPLAFIGVPEAEVDMYADIYKFSAATKGGQLIFRNSRGETDVAIFSTKTIQRFAQAMAEVQPPRVPRSWF